MVKALFFSVVLVLFLLGCRTGNKSKNDVPKISLLAGTESKTWVVRRLIKNGVEQSLTECNLCNYVVYFRNGNYKNYYSDSTCGPVTLANWYFLNNQTQVTFTKEGLPYYNLVKLTSDSLVYKILDSRNLILTLIKVDEK